MEVGKCLRLDNSVSMDVMLFSWLCEGYTTVTQLHYFEQSRSVLHCHSGMPRARVV